MPKTKLSDVFKNSDDFKIKQIDWSDEEFAAMLKAIKKEQEKCMERKKINWKLLDNFYITI